MTINSSKASVRWAGKEYKAAIYGIVRASWSDGTTVAIAEGGDAILIPRAVVGDLYGDLKPGQRIRVDVGDDLIATSIAKA